MRHFRAILVTVTILILLISWPRHSPAQNTPTPTPQAAKGNLSTEGTVTNAEGSPVENARVTITLDHIVRVAVSNRDGRFRIGALSPGTANIVYDAPGYNRLEEHGVLLADGMDLSKTLQEKRADSRWALLLLIPGVVGLAWCAGCDYYDEKLRKKPGASARLDNQFGLALLGGATWAITLFVLVRFGLGTGGVNTLYLFHWSLPMEVYIPVFGFVGALLFVLDLRRRYGKDSSETPEEEIPKGKEFGMRMFMGPYVAIVMVALFGNDLGFADFTSPAAKGTLAFFSGLLVIVALQGLIERGQETLGRWRQKSLLKTPEGRKERKEELKEVMGNLVWGRLQKVGVNTVAEFAHLGNPALERLAAEEPPLLKENLVALRDKAKEVAIPS